MSNYIHVFKTLMTPAHTPLFTFSIVQWKKKPEEHQLIKFFSIFAVDINTDYGQ